MKVGLVGLGRMGAAIFLRLKDHGFSVIGWDRDPDATKALGSQDLTVAAGPRAVAEHAEIVISIITEDSGVQELFLGDQGFLTADVRGKLFIEMSTLRPMTHRKLSPLVREKGAHLIDAPVMGSIPTVAQGKLLVLAGGERADVERARGVLDVLARRIVHMGPAGSGCAMKLAVNLGMAVYLQSLAEGIALGEAEGLPLERMLEIFCDSPIANAWLNSKVATLKGEPSETTLDIRTLRKDVMSAVATGALAGVGMPATSGALASLSAAVASGWGQEDLAQMPRYFREFMIQSFD